MPIKIIRNDIVMVGCDAIVNAANTSLLGGGGVDGAIHRAAGKELLLECMRLGGCKTGQAKITKGYRLPCKYVIHTVGPKWKGGDHGEAELLRDCYLNSLELALEHDCESVAFPIISSGAYGYPREDALRIAVNSIVEFLMEHDMLVYLVVYDQATFRISERLFRDIASYIDRIYDEPVMNATYRECCCIRETESQFEDSIESTLLYEEQLTSGKNINALSLEEAVNRVEESFAQMLFREIDARGMKDAECYKRANVDKRLFSKIRSDKNYHPSKTTVIAFAIALELDLQDTRKLLETAGYALSHSNKFDIIIEYFICRGNYNIFEINEALFAFGQNLLGE